MPAVFVHGNPETAAIWDRVVAAMRDVEVVCLSPPGFGAPVPSGWVSTPARYTEWLSAQLEALGRPVHLVGHDWGGAHVVNVAMARPDLLDSWTTDAIGMFDPDFTWHALAQVWQTLDDGEQAAEQLTAPTVAQRFDYLRAIGLGEDVAGTIAANAHHVSARTMLELYRAARQPTMARSGDRLESASSRPGLVIVAAADNALGSVAVRRRAAAVREDVSSTWSDVGTGG